MRDLALPANDGDSPRPAAALPSHYPTPDARQLRRRAELYAQLAMLASNAETADRLKALAERFARDAEEAESRSGRPMA